MGNSSFPQTLAGLTVLDLSLLLPGPFCTSILARFGAEIIKVEPKGIGDPTRRMSESVFNQFNRGKSSIVIDLKMPEGQDVLRRMAGQAQGLIEGFRPGVMDRLGVGYQELAQDNPGLVYCSLSGFGQDGPYRDRPAHDLNFLGLAGYFSVPSQLNNVKARPNVRLADLVAGQNAAMAMAMAMVTARDNGKGCHIDCAIFDAISAWSLPLMLATEDADDLEPADYAHVMGDSDMFETKDGKFLTLGTLEDKFWRNLVAVIGATEPGLMAEKYATRRGRDRDKQEINTLLATCFTQKTLQQWSDLLEHADTTWGPVYEGSQALSDPHLKARGLLRGQSDPQGAYCGFPVAFSGDRGTDLSDAPALGENSRDILQRFGFDIAEIKSLETAETVPLLERT